MANTLEQIIADIEAGKVKAPEAAVIEKTAEPKSAAEPQVNKELEDLRKFAASIDSQARQFADSFLDQIQKVAVGVGPLTPNTGTPADNPAVQVANEDIQLGDVAKVEGIIKKLTQGGEQRMTPAGVVHEQGVPVAAADPDNVDEYPLAADVKKADADIITTLYNKYFNVE